MPIEVTWTDDDYDDEEEQKIGHGQEEEENLSRSPYSGDDEYEEDEDTAQQTKFEQQWQQFNSVSGPNDQQFQDQELEPQELPQEGEEELPSGQEQEQREKRPGGDIGDVKLPQGRLVAVETTYKVTKPSEEDSYLCGLASIILEHCDLRDISKVEDSTTQVTVITQMDDPNDPTVDASGEWENLVTPKGMETQDKGLQLDIPLEDQDNQSMDGSIHSTRTSATQETERTAIETELAPIQLSSRTKSRRKSSFLKWSKPTSSKKKVPGAPTIIPPVENEAISPPIAAVEKEAPEPISAPMEISTSSLDLQREISLLEFDDANHTDNNLRIIGLSPAESFEEMNSVTSPTLVTDDAASEGNYLDEDEATLLSDPRNNRSYMVKPIQSIEVIYDPNLFNDEEEKVGDGTRYCSLWPMGAKKSRGRFYR